MLHLGSARIPPYLPCCDSARESIKQVNQGQAFTGQTSGGPVKGAELGKLETVEPREIWANEAGEFTPWLAENLHLLGERLGLDLQLEDQEASVGAFKADILAVDSATQKAVVIENQLEESDHEHLGKILTYASGREAAISIWISPQIRDEHQAALHWLNDVTGPDTAFFGIEIEVLRIGTSDPAPNFKVVVQPNEWVKSQRTGRREVSELGTAYSSFWTKMLQALRDRHAGITNAKAGNAYNWHRFAAGRTGFYVQTRFGRDSTIWAELVIDYGEKAYNKWAFDRLISQRADVEAATGTELEWFRYDESQYSTIGVSRGGSLDKDGDNWGDQALWFADRAAGIYQAFYPRVRELEYSEFEAASEKARSEGMDRLSDS